jgi:hypothetical protein
MITDIRTTILQMLVEDVPQNLERFEEKTGRFLTGDGWAVTNQDLVYPLALLYRTEHPDNPYYQDERILAYALEGGDAWRDFQYPDGKVEFVKVDGSRWGPIYMPWSMYHWLETYALLRDEMDGGRRRRWEEGLALAYDGIAADLAEGRVHNIPTWNGMATYRAGQIFGQRHWQQAGQAMIEQAVAAQMPGGYWLEHHGPTPAYNYVYVHAIGLYHRFSGDDRVLACLERATDFHIRYTYPDGRTVETIDGRVKYHDHVTDNAYAAFSLFPRGRRYVRLLLENMMASRAGRTEPHLTYIITSGTLKIASAEYGLSPRLASAYIHYQDGPEAPIPQDEAAHAIHDEGHALLRRRAGWFTCLSGVVTPAVESRWGQDRQSYLSVWHEAAGLVIGGGNAKDQPAFSTFVVGSGDEQHYLPVAAALHPLESADSVSLTYGEHTCTLQVAVEDAHHLRLTFAAPAGVAARAQVPLKIRTGTPLQTATGAEFETGRTPVAITAESAGGWVSHGGWRISLPAGSTLNWPVSPFNPYAADGAGPLDEASAVLAVPLQGDPISIEVTCN